MSPRLGVWLAILLCLASCNGVPLPARETHAVGACQAGPDGEPLAERGIGGTGGPAVAERGIGDTGIIGVITGFAGVCLAGQEVALTPQTTVGVDALATDPPALRVGQVAAVAAVAGADGLQARRINIRFEVVGPVEMAEADRLRVAGQTVLVSAATTGLRPRVGDFVAVSGLRREDGGIDSTRIELHPPGPVLVHGPLTKQGGVPRLGTLRLPADPVDTLLVGREVTVVGSLVAGDELVIDHIEPDLLASDPIAYFGPTVASVVIEGIAVARGTRVLIGRSTVSTAPGFHLGGPRRGVFRLERRGRETMVVGAGGDAASAPSPDFSPAPVPNRTFGPAQGGGNLFGRGSYGPGRAGVSSLGGGRRPEGRAP